MSTTPGKGRTSGIPAPGRTSHIPTPGRPRSASSIHYAGSVPDDDFAFKAFEDAIKANDPATHRPTYPDGSLSPAAHTSISGRTSVAGRPASAASSSSAVSSAVRSTTGTKTAGPRPSSRTSDIFARSSSRAGRTFDIGDRVRIESLGFEGLLKFLGEIDGKAGLFAGVELGGGFAGKGKNNGSVNGKRYFTCPPNCGVFIAAAKLSSPTVGAASISRPSSVASSRNGRATPSISGRVTPAFPSISANGRKTPSFTSGRTTPASQTGRITPSTSNGRRTSGGSSASTRSKPPTTPKSVISPVRSIAAAPIITPGSRASRYVGMTAKQLSNRTTGSSSPTRSGVSSPTSTRKLISPTTQLTSPPRAPSSPFTPRAARVATGSMGPPTGTPTRARTMTTPRARLSSNASMPPPVSPSSHRTTSVSLNDPIRLTSASLNDLSANQRAIQEMIDKVARPASSASMTSRDTEMQLQLQVDRLQSRLNASENENKRLHASLTAAESSVSAVNGRAELLNQEREESSGRISELQASLRSAEKTLNERDSTIETLQQAAEQSAAELEKARTDGEARTRDLQSKLQDNESLIAQIQELVSAKEGMQTENDAALAAKNAQIAMLEARVQKAYVELEEERRELGSQIDELRAAGQETIALYEERLSAADSRRYEMEDLIASLEDRVQAQARPISPATMARQASSALEIDNEALREQIQHLQKKIAQLEDMLEDAHAATEREEQAGRDRLVQYKEREDVALQDLDASRKEVERVAKLEESARNRVVEIEEALRENTVALENARADIEVLRAEIADLEGNAANSDDVEKPSHHAPPSMTATGDFELLKADKLELERLCKENQAEISQQREASASLQRLLDERTVELDALRKKIHREQPVNGLPVDSSKSVSVSPSKQDIAAAKDEIKGLKHIIQELQLENTKAAQRTKVLESENKLLLTEMDQLREDMKALEDSVEQTLLREEQALEAEEAALASPSDDASLSQKTIRDMKAKYEAELEQMRKRLTEAEMKSARTTHDLNKEIGELESLIESKIYREDELERELSRLQERLAKSQKKSSKNSLPDDSRSSMPSMSSSASSRSESAMSTSTSRSGEDVCEICERPGHDIFSCDLLKEDQPLSGESISTRDFLKKNASVDLYCEDCEEHGHTAADCPHSLDVF